jgi:hypothetical protein
LQIYKVILELLLQSDIQNKKILMKKGKYKQMLMKYSTLKWRRFSNNKLKKLI